MLSNTTFQPNICCYAQTLQTQQIKVPYNPHKFKLLQTPTPFQSTPKRLDKIPKISLSQRTPKAISHCKNNYFSTRQPIGRSKCTDQFENIHQFVNPVKKEFLDLNQTQASVSRKTKGTESQLEQGTFKFQNFLKISSEDSQKQQFKNNKDKILQISEEVKNKDIALSKISTLNRKKSIANLIKQRKCRQNSDNNTIKKLNSLRLGKSICTIISEVEDQRSDNITYKLDESVVQIDFFDRAAETQLQLE